METCFHNLEQNRMEDMFSLARAEQNGGHFLFISKSRTEWRHVSIT